MMQCPNCNATLEKGAAFCGICGHQIAPLYAQGATVSDATSKTEISSNYPPQAPTMQPPYSPQSMPPQQQGGFPQMMPNTPPYAPPVTPARPPQPSRNNRRNVFIIATIAILVVVIAVSSFVLFNQGGKGTANQAAASPTVQNSKPTTAATTAPVQPAEGPIVNFKDGANSRGTTDSLLITAKGLAAPPAGSTYFGWIVKSDESFIPLGALKQDGNAFVVDYPGVGKKNVLQPLATGIEITEETGTTQPPAPSPNIVLTSTFPAQEFVHIRHLLYRFDPIPTKTALAVGLLDQSTKLNAQATVLKSAKTPKAQMCALWSIVDIIEGKQGANYTPLAPNGCGAQNITEAGDGIGILGKSLGQAQDSYAIFALNHASLAAGQADSTDASKVHFQHVKIAIQDIVDWGKQIDQAAVAMIKSGTVDPNKVDDIATLADHLLNGFDKNNNEKIDIAPGEPGAKFAYQHAQLMAQVLLEKPKK